MTASSLPTRRPRWRAGLMGVAIAVASFTATACGGESAGENEVIEEGEVGVGEEDAGTIEDTQEEDD